MSKPGQTIWGIIGFKCQGDVGPITTYTNRKMIVWFLKAWLRDPVSPDQIKHRNRIRACAAHWNATTETVRRNYELASKRGQTRITGYNLWVHASMAVDGPQHLVALARQTGIALPPPPLE